MSEASSGELRASDADRDRLIEFLREHYTQGRLDGEEFQERMEAVYRAKTMAELAPLTRDLPARDLNSLPVPASRAANAPAVRVGVRHPAVVIPWGIWGGVSALNVVIWFLVSVGTPGWAYPWWIWVAAPAGVVLLTLTFVLGVLGVLHPEQKRRGG
jgi:hypothetical protein